MVSDHAQPVRLGVIAMVGLIAACATSGPDESPLLSDGKRAPALLAFYGDTTTVQLPPSTRVGEPTELHFTSFAGGCVRKDSTDVEVSGLEAEVRAYRLEPRDPATVCTMELRLDENLVQLRIMQPGRARVRIVGLQRPGDRPFVVERELVVTP